MNIRKVPNFFAAALIFISFFSAYAEEVKKEDADAKPAIIDDGKLPLISESYVYDDFARLIFQGEGLENFRAEINDGQLKVYFDKPVRIDFQNILKGLRAYVGAVATSGDFSTVVLKLKDKGTKFRKFAGDGFVGIDLIRSDVLVAPKVTPMILPESRILAELLDQDSGAELYGPPPPPEVSAEDKPRKKKIAGEMDVDRDRLNNGIKVVFPWDEEVSAAVFGRNDYVWAIFNAPQKLKFDNIKGIKYIESIKQVFHPNFTIVRIKIPPEFKTSSLKKDGQLIDIRGYSEGKKWIVEMQENPSSPPQEEIVANPLAVLSHTGSQGPYVMVVTPDAAQPLNMIDTEVGDNLVVFPMLGGETGVGPERKYIDFNLPRTAQGVVLQPISDEIQYLVSEKGIEIRSSTKLSVSPELFSKEEEVAKAGEKKDREKKAVLATETVFPFQKVFSAKEGEASDYFSRLKFFSDAIRSSNQDERSVKRLDLAKFYFSEGLYHESLSVLRYIKIIDPVFAASQEIDLMIAACDYAMKHYVDSEGEFSVLAEEAKRSESHDEVKFWQWASHYNLAKERGLKPELDIPVDYIASYDKFMQNYPKDLRYSFGLLAVEFHLQKGNIDAAKTVLEIISYDDVPEQFVNDTKYIRAQLAEAEGNYDQAKKIYAELTEEVFDRFNRARAIFAVNRLKLANAEITVDEAVNNFTQVGYIWRGDNFELELLKLVGQLYVKEGQYYKGLKAWQVLVTNFPSTKEALFIAGKMKKTFVTLFDEGEAYKLPPFEALSLYFEFRELTPVGERGDKIIQQLAEHFIKADLLENAAAIINHQVRFRALGEEKNRLTLKLADLYLKNKKPTLVFEALEYLDKEKADAKTLAEAKYLRGRAQIALGEYEKTYELLRDDFNDGANDLRVEIFWNIGNWFGIMNIIEPRIELMKADRQPLSDKNIEDIVKLAVAYGSQEYRDKLRKLKTDLGHRITNKRALNVFEFVTNDIPNINYKDFTRTVQLGEIEDFMTEYAFWPGKDWKNIAAVLGPKTEGFKRDEPPLTPSEIRDVVRLGIAYSMIMLAGDKEGKEAEKSLRTLNSSFRNVTVNKDTIEVFRILDDKFVAKEDDVIFEGKLPLAQIPEFIEKYKNAKKYSELNAAIAKK